MSTQTLDDIFNGTDPNEASEVPETPPAQETPSEPQADATDEGETPKGEEGNEETPAVKEETPASENDRMVPLKALEAERKKRQEAEAKIQQVPAEPPKPAPDVIEDQKGFEAHVQQTVDQALYNQRLSISESTAKKTHDDFDDMVETFIGLAQDNPALGQAMRDHIDPAEFAYQEAKKSIAMTEIGSDPAAFKEQLRKEVEAEIREKLEAEAKAGAEGETLRNIPTSLANEPSVAGRGQPEWAGPDTMDDMLTRTGERSI